MKPETEDDRFLKKAKVLKIESLHRGTGYCVRKVLEKFPHADRAEIFRHLNRYLHQNISEKKAVRKLIKKLRKRDLKLRKRLEQLNRAPLKN